MSRLNWDDIVFHPDVIKENISDLRQKKGYAFELLIFNLLKCMYPNFLFQLTPRNGDGGKDIVQKYQDKTGTAFKIENYWIECKNHERNLGIDIISNTLVMALIDDIDTIMIFSKSEISANYFNNISRYMNKAKKKIITYAGSVLEQLILSNRNNSNLAFDLFFKSGVLSNGLNISLIDIYSCSDKEQYFQKEKIYIKLFIKNQTDQKLKIIVEETSNKKLSLIKTDLTSNELFLDSFELKIVHYVYKIIDYDSVLDLPIYNIFANNKEFKTPKKNVKCEKLIYSYYVGDGLKDLSNINNLKNVQFCYPIIGKSGTGKSRFAKEMQDIFLQNRYDVLYIDLEIENTDNTLKQIIAFLYDLPFFASTLNFSITNNEVANLIYNSNPIVSFGIDSIVKFILNKIDKKKIVFIDNFQCLEKQSLQIFEKIFLNEYNYTFERLLKFAIIFNEDYFNNDNIINFYGKIRKKYIPYVIKNLYNHSLEFVYGSLGVNKSTNEAFLTQLTEECHYNPLLIQNVLQLYLQTKSISIESSIVIVNENIVKNNRFSELVDFENIMKYREKIILENLNEESKQNYFYIISYLIFFKKIKYDQCLLLINDEVGLINRLRREGIIDCNNLEITFFHNMLFESFYKMYYTNNEGLLPKKLSKKILETTKDACSFPYIVAYYSFNKNLTDSLLKNLLSLYQTAKYFNEDFIFLNFICKIAFSIENTWTCEDKVKMIYELSNAAVRLHGVKRSYEIVNPYIETIMKKKDIYAKGNEINFYNALRVHINKLILMNENRLASNILKNAIDSLENEQKLYEIKSILFNRYSVTLSSLCKFKESIYWAEKGFYVAKKDKNQRYIIENLIDLAYTYYFINDKKKCLKYLKKARKVYTKTKTKTEFFIAKYYSYNSLYLLIKQNYKKYETFSKELIERLDSTNRPFYEITMRLGLCTYYTIIDFKNKKMENYEKFNFFMNQLDILIINYDAKRFKYKKEYILSNYLYYVKKDNAAADNYYKTLILFLDSVEDENNLKKYSILLEDILKKIKKSTTEEKFFEYLYSLKKHKEYILKNIGDLLNSNKVSLLTDPTRSMVFPTI